jgi:putative membrane protein
MLENQTLPQSNRFYVWLIGILSVVVPLLVAFLMFGGNQLTRIEGLDVSFLPHLNAILNTATFSLLVLGFIAVRQKQVAYHRMFMMSAFILSAIFLLSYVVYHSNAVSTKFGGEGIIRYAYFFILITHIILAAIVLPLVLFSFQKGLQMKIEQHRKLVRWTFPIWLYVTTSGVIVYLMISPYYTF